ncbi:MerR family transcriptional regulator [Thiomicrorhabdus aquaedulcis]|uniref:MerR family transcriptional regulator n=1 Tax=Thiomicrorhabdus aquaedulcis TaxID=2211106 RepID=UPI000FD6F9A8|nr:MerR family transcriptional regulator [Thiomicrorhabdus aquaedulcis]
MNLQQALYPIREVANLTGINPITLRAWERRYSLIEPVRTDGGHRLYTAQNIETIKHAIQLTEQGVPISHVKGLIQLNTVPKVLVNHEQHTLSVAQITTWLTQANLASLSQALDSLFVELDDQSLYRLLTQISLDLAELKLPSEALWINELLPKLYSRLHHRLKAIVTQPNAKRHLVVTIEPNNAVIGILTALWLSHKGLYPVINYPTHANYLADATFKTLLEHAKNLSCTGLALVSTTGDNPMLLDLWQQQARSQSSLELYVFSPNNYLNPLLNTQQALNNHLIGFEDMF